MVLAHPLSLEDFDEELLLERAEAFWKNVNISNEWSCWEWKGASVMTAGYGQVSIKGRALGTHRFAYLLRAGVLRKGLVIRHLCHNRLCCNPHHLVEGTYAENIDDQRNRTAEEDYLHDMGVRALKSSGEWSSSSEADDELWDDILG